MTKFEFDINEFTKTAEQLGISVELKSNNPGLFAQTDNGLEKIEVSKALPKIFSETAESTFILPGLTATLPKSAKINLEIKGNKTFSSSSLLPGAA